MRHCHVCRSHMVRIDCGLDKCRACDRRSFSGYCDEFSCKIHHNKEDAHAGPYGIYCVPVFIGQRWQDP